MPTHRIVYEGPASLAVPTATLLADAQGVKLTSSDAPQPRDGLVVLGLTVEATAEAVAAAVEAVRSKLPPDATLTVREA